MVSDIINTLKEGNDTKPLFYLINDKTNIETITCKNIYDEFLYYDLKLRGFNNKIVCIYYPVSAKLIGFVLAAWSNNVKILVKRTTLMSTYDIIRDIKQTMQDIPINYVFVNRILEGLDCTDRVEENLYKLNTIFDIKFTNYDFIQMSSGTTTVPRGFCLSYEALEESANHVINIEKINNNSVIGSYLTLSHIYGFVTGFMIPLLKGIPCYLCKTTIIHNNPEYIFRMINDNRITHISVVMSTLINALKTIGNITYDLSSIKCMSIGGEKINVEIFKETTNKLKNYGITPNALTNSYGMSEKGSITMEDPCQENSIIEYNNQYFLSVGSDEQFNVKIKIINENKFESDDIIGKIAIENNNIAKRYFQKGKIFKNNFTTVNNKKFYLNGDYGFIHDHKVYVLGRLSNIITYNGLKISGETVSSYIIKYLNLNDINVVRCIVFNLPDEYNILWCFIDYDSTISEEILQDININLYHNYHLQVSRFIIDTYAGSGLNKLSVPWIIKYYFRDDESKIMINKV